MLIRFFGVRFGDFRRSSSSSIALWAGAFLVASAGAVFRAFSPFSALLRLFCSGCFHVSHPLPAFLAGRSVRFVRLSGFGFFGLGKPSAYSVQSEANSSEACSFRGHNKQVFRGAFQAMCKLNLKPGVFAARTKGEILSFQKPALTSHSSGTSKMLHIFVAPQFQR